MKTPYFQLSGARTKLLLTFAAGTIALGLFTGPLLAQDADDQDTGKNHRRSTAEDFLRLNVKPVAIGHHGVGPNTGEDPALPIENTVESVRKAYQEGARVVEVDVQLTKDGRLAVFHDDFLADYSCVHSLTLQELRRRLH